MAESTPYRGQKVHVCYYDRGNNMSIDDIRILCTQEVHAQSWVEAVIKLGNDFLKPKYKTFELDK